MKRTILRLFSLFSIFHLQAQIDGGGGGYVFPKSGSACLSDAERTAIKAELKKM